MATFPGRSCTCDEDRCNGEMMAVARGDWTRKEGGKRSARSSSEVLQKALPG
jgi:hypothetical protein